MSYDAEAFSLYTAGGERKYLNAAERAAFLACARDRSPTIRSFLFLLAYSGCRISEALETTPRRVQRPAGVVSFRTLKRRKFHVREVPLAPAVLEYLEVSHGRALAAGGDARLFTFCRQTGWQYVSDVMARAGISGKKACPKGLRHSFGIHALQRNVPITLVSRWLGHASLKTTEIYTTALGPEERQIASRMW